MNSSRRLVPTTALLAATALLLLVSAPAHAQEPLLSDDATVAQPNPTAEPGLGALPGAGSGEVPGAGAINPEENPADPAAPGEPAEPDNPAGTGESTSSTEPSGPATEVRDTENCQYQTLPPEPVDTSEVPAPGQTSPAPLPVPKQRSGGEKMAACGTVAAENFKVPEDISASSWIVYDLKSGDVLAAKDPHGRYRPASIIKVLLAMEAIDELDLRDVVKATADDANMEGSRVGIVADVDYTVETLLLGLLLNSGNDAGHALADQLGGMDATTEKVNALATKLGATDTRVVNPTGLDAPGQMTSAYDMALFFQYAFNNPTYRKLSATPLTTIPGDKEREIDDFEIANDNQLITQDYPGALGGKTGFTDDARHTFSGVAERDGRRLGVVILDATVNEAPRPWEQAAALLDAGFATPQGNSVGVLEAQPEDDSSRNHPLGLFDGDPTETGLKVSVGAGVVVIVALIALLVSRFGLRLRGKRKSGKRKAGRGKSGKRGATGRGKAGRGKSAR